MGHHDLVDTTSLVCPQRDAASEKPANGALGMSQAAASGELLHRAVPAWCMKAGVDGCAQMHPSPDTVQMHP